MQVAKKFAINYSTAKSIVQSYKKRGGCAGKVEERTSETDECESLEGQC
jgi:transposase